MRVSCPLSDYVDVNPPTDVSHRCPDERVSFIPMASVEEGGGWSSDAIRPLSSAKTGYTLFRDGDVICAKITPCFENGKLALLRGLVGGVGLGSTEFHVLRPRNDTDARFIYQWVQHPEFRRAGEAAMTGSAGQRRVPPTFFQRFEVPIIEPAEQRAIADVLESVDAAIRETEALIAKLKRLRLGLIDDLLTRGLENDGSPRDPSTLAETAVGLRAATWVVANLGRFVVGAEYGTNRSLGDSSAGIPVLRMNNIQDGELDLSDLKYAPAHDVERFRLQRNEVLFNRTNSWEHVGKAAIWRRDEPGPAFASYLVRLHCGDDLLPEFLHLWLNWAPVQRAIRQFATPGVQQVNINPTNLRRALIAVPDTLDEQQAIIGRVNAVAAAIGDHRRERAKLSSLREGLRDDLLSGHKPVVVIREAAE